MMRSKFSKLGKKEQDAELPKSAEDVERMVEDVRRMATETQKLIQSSVLLQKRNKKTEEQKFAAGLKECLDKTSGEPCLCSTVVRKCMDMNTAVATARRDYEEKVERMVTGQLQRLSEEICSSVAKQRRAYNKCASETQTAREQWQKLTLSNTNVAAASTTSLNAPSEEVMARQNRAQSLMIDKEGELSNAKDNLLRELYSFTLQEDQYATIWLEFLRLQEAYLAENLKLVRTCIPEVMSSINTGKPLTAFNRHLPTHLEETKRSLAYVLEICITFLDNEDSLQLPGIFRLSGSQKKTDLLLKALDLMCLDESILDISVTMSVASALKQYLANMPEPIITYSFAEKWADASKDSLQPSVDCVQPFVDAMPVEFRLNLAYLCLFLAKVASYSDVNKMTVENLAIVVGPNIFRLLNTTSNAALAHALGESQASNLDVSKDFLQNSGPGILLTELLIRHADIIFASEKAILENRLQTRSGTGSQTDSHTSHSRSSSACSLSDIKPSKPQETHNAQIKEDSVQRSSNPGSSDPKSLLEPNGKVSKFRSRLPGMHRPSFKINPAPSIPECVSIIPTEDAEADLQGRNTGTGTFSPPSRSSNPFDDDFHSEPPSAPARPVAPPVITDRSNESLREMRRLKELPKRPPPPVAGFRNSYLIDQ